MEVSRPSGEIICSDVCASELELARLSLNIETLVRIRVASVRGVAVATALREICQSRWGISPEFASPQRFCAGVTSGYESPETLGVDRWLAMLAAFNRSQGACCIVDAGSAATLDIINKEGRHLGGYIVPGLSLQRRSLLESTGIKLPDMSRWPDSLQLGSTTSKAIHGGIISMFVEWVRQVSQVINAREASTLYLTGGDAALISGHLDRCAVEYRLVPELVLDGLAFALP